MEHAAQYVEYATTVLILCIWALFVVPSIVALFHAIDSYKARILASQHKAEVLVATETRTLRAAQHRASEREWGRS